MSPPRRAQIEPRHRFVPPLLPMAPVERAADLAAASPCAPLGDVRGEALCPRARIACGWSGDALHLRARVEDPSPVIAPERDPADHRFWMQDHIEWRLLPDPAWDMDQVQVLLTASGRCLVDGGIGEEPVAVEVEVDATGWTLCARLDATVLGRAAFRAGDRIAGLVAHVSWASGAPDIAVMTPAVLGFSQAERFGIFACAVPAPVVLADLRHRDGERFVAGANTCEVTLRAVGPATTGRVVAELDARVVLDQAVSVDPGGTSLELALELERPRYRQLRLRWVDAAGDDWDLGSATLRAAVEPVVPAIPLRHPYLEGDADEWQRRRAVLDREPYRTLADQRSAGDPEAAEAALPDPEAADAFHFTPECGAWFRICRESLLRDGEGGKKAAAERIWSLLSDAGRRPAAPWWPTPDPSATTSPRCWRTSTPCSTAPTCGTPTPSIGCTCRPKPGPCAIATVVRHPEGGISSGSTAPCSRAASNASAPIG